MSGLVVLLWVGNIFFDTLGQLAFKSAATLPDKDGQPGSVIHYWTILLKRPFLWVGIFAYVAEFFLWLAFLTLVPLSEGVLLGSVNIIIIMILGRIFFGEELTRMRLIGISLVAFGVAVVGAF